MKAKLFVIALAAMLPLAGYAAVTNHPDYPYVSTRVRSGKQVFAPSNHGAPATRVGVGTRRKGAEPPPEAPVEYCVDTVVCGVPLDDDDVSCVWVEVCGEAVE